MRSLLPTLACLALLPASIHAATTRSATTVAAEAVPAAEWRRRAVAEVGRIDTPDRRIRVALTLSRIAPSFGRGESGTALARLVEADIGQAGAEAAAVGRRFLADDPATRPAPAPSPVDALVPKLREEGAYALIDVSSAVYNAGNGRPLPDAEFHRVLDAMEAAAAKLDQPVVWSRLTLTYLRLAGNAFRNERPERARRLLDRAVDLLVAHPALQPPRTGNTDAPSAWEVVTPLADAGREADLKRVAAALPVPDRRRVLFQWIGRLASAGDFDGARKLADEPFAAPADPELAATTRAMKAAMNGEPFDDEASGLVGSVAFGFAHKGDVAAAERLLDLPGMNLEQQYWQRKALAQKLFEGGHASAAHRQLRQAWEAYPKLNYDGMTEVQHLADAALEIDAEGVAADIFAGDPSFWLVEPQVAFARRKRLAGDPDAARRLLADAAVRAERTSAGDGGPARFLAMVAAERAGLGDDLLATQLIERAARLDEGMNDTFFFARAGYAAIIGTCREMNRPDLAARAFDALSRPADRALFAAIAAQAAVE